MNVENTRQYILSLPQVTEDMPFDDTVLAFRIGNKIFALMSLVNDPTTINLKCNPEKAIEYRETYSSIIPGFHMNKTHWNTVIMDNDMTWSLLQDLIKHSYDLVFQSLPGKVKKEMYL